MTRKGFFIIAGLMMFGCASETSHDRVECTDSANGDIYYCSAMQICGNGECISADDENCGRAGNVCLNGNECQINIADPSQSQCVCRASNNQYCSQTCVAGVGCVDINSNVNHCGAPNNACLSGEVCDNGKCSATCSSGLTQCDTTCVDTDSDPKHCGGCNQACPQTGEHISRSYCSDGTCRVICERGFVDEDDDGLSCEKEVSSVCGNGIVEEGEACDGLKLNDKTCESILGEGSRGTLTCINCMKFDTSACLPATTCGNGKIDSGERCDGNQLSGATCESIVGMGSTGSLQCDTNCGDYDTSLCTPPVTCGNNTIDGNEECDGSVPEHVTCESLVGTGSSGTVRCSSSCQLDRSGCTSAAVCGDGIISSGEICDGDNFGGKTCESEVGVGSVGSLKCDACGRIDTSYCSAASTCANGKVDAGEVCDGNDLKGATCESVVGAGSTGTLKCASNCGSYDISGCTAAATCGDGVIQAHEACDGRKLNDKTCADFNGMGSVGTLKCNPTCTGFDTSGCTASTTCGNGVIEGKEVCDRENVNKMTCTALVGKGSVGTVYCTSDCTHYDLSGCSAPTTCENGKVDDGEVCDGDDLKGATCESVVGAGSTGKLRCGDGCKHYDTTGCSKSTSCGDGAINGKEVCDGEQLGGRTCASEVGFGSKGTLACNSTCTGFDTSRCSEEKTCGNGKLDAGETCDGSFLNGTTCSALVGYGSTGTPVCNDTCSGFKTSADGYEGCTAAKKCGNGILDEGETCDSANLNGATCEAVIGYGSTGTPACNSTCTGYTRGTCTEAKKCGNGKLDAGEACDGALLNNATCETVVGIGSTGTLTCDSNCQYNTTHCSASRGCGNGTVEDGEQCDGNTFANGDKYCKNYAPSLYSSGTLSCTNKCTVDVSGCKAYCGNGTVNGTVSGVYIGEACDKGTDGTNPKFPTSQNTCEKVVGTGSTGSLSCSDDCKSIITKECSAAAICGDGILNQSSEECDGTVYREGSDCSDYSSEYESGTKVTCTASCKIDTSMCKKKVVATCGDGTVNQASEYCDGTAFKNDATSCSAWNTKYVSGNVTCNKDCSINYGSCLTQSDIKKCGNGVVDENELCDGTKFYGGITTCAVYSPDEYASGNLKCTDKCTIDESSCVEIAKPYCGNGVIDDGELCDGKELPFSYTACNKYDSTLYQKGTVKCSADCKSIDVSACQTYCGNGNVNTSRDEVCDGTNLAGKTCEKLKGEGSTGTLLCADDCRSFDDSGCSVPYHCGDGIVNGEEYCDGTDFFMDKDQCSEWSPELYASGTVKCTKSCTLDFSNCKEKATPICGDGIINQTSEECDGKALSSDFTWNCEDLDSAYMGSLTCGSDCKLNIDACVLKPVTNCGNGKLDDDEFCDGTKFLDNTNQCSDWSNKYASGIVTCNSDCTINESACVSHRCGDGILDEANELCDGTKFLDGLNQCTNISSNYSGGTAKCTSSCDIDESTCIRKCGDGKLSGDEWCDPGTDGKSPIFDTSSDTCDDWLPGTIGSLSCTSTCEIDTSACVAKPSAYCGDGIVNTSSEACDGKNYLLGSDNCTDYSSTYISGKLTCNKDCTVNTSACQAPKCGNGKLDDDEYCDGSSFMFGISTCKEYSPTYVSGMLKCTSKCEIDTTGCQAEVKCGNGKLDDDEWCDGTLFLDNDDNCTSMGYASGKLTCSPSCQLVTTSCVSKAEAKCGDGVVNQTTEDCDKTAFRDGKTLCSQYSSAYKSGNLKCTSSCQYDLSSCVKDTASKCGDGIVQDGEDCDGSAFYADVDTCSEYSSDYGTGNLKCQANCKYDFSNCGNICEDGDIRCVGNSLQICMKEGTSPLNWQEADVCSGSKPICDEAKGDCVAAAVTPVDLQWCTFQWLATDDSNKGYGRILLPSGKSENDVLAYMACTNDITKPVSSWETVDAVLNPSCSNCGANKEFMTETGYTGKTGTNYCTFIFDFVDEGMFACRPQQDGESAPILITEGSTKLSADLTRTFTKGTVQCEENQIRCNDTNLEICMDGTWTVYETCQGSTPICSVADEACIAKTAVSYDNTVTFSDKWTATSAYSSKQSQSFSDGSTVATVNVAVYTSGDHTIDGTTVVLDEKSSSEINITGLSTGVGTLEFQYKTWGSNDSSELTITDGKTTQTVTVAKTDTSTKKYTYNFNNASATMVKISIKQSKNRQRVLVDNVRFTSAK